MSESHDIEQIARVLREADAKDCIGKTHAKILARAILPLLVSARAQWQDIGTAPEDEYVILATDGGHVGEAIMLFRDEDNGSQQWDWAAAGRLHPSHTPLKWMPLPLPPSLKEG